MKGLRLTFHEKLPNKFDRKEYLKTAKELGINSRTAERYITLFKTKLLDYNYNKFKKIIGSITFGVGSFL